MSDSRREPAAPLNPKALRDVYEALAAADAPASRPAAPQQGSRVRHRRVRPTPLDPAATWGLPALDALDEAQPAPPLHVQPYAQAMAGIRPQPVAAPPLSARAEALLIGGALICAILFMSFIAYLVDAALHVQLR